MVPAGLMPPGEDNQMVLEGDAATATAVGDHRRARGRLRRADAPTPIALFDFSQADMSTTAPRRIAVVGSGVAGLTAAYVASRTAHVTLFEADERLGGHADTHVVPTADGELRIDTGFIVHNRRTYPTLLRLFAELDIATQPSEMSLSVSDRGTGVEYAGALGARGLFPTRAARHLARRTGGCWPRSRASTGAPGPS